MKFGIILVSLVGVAVGCAGRPDVQSTSGEFIVVRIGGFG